MIKRIEQYLFVFERFRIITCIEIFCPDIQIEKESHILNNFFHSIALQNGQDIVSHIFAYLNFVKTRYLQISGTDLKVLIESTCDNVSKKELFNTVKDPRFKELDIKTQAIMMNKLKSKAEEIF